MTDTNSAVVATTANISLVK